MIDAFADCCVFFLCILMVDNLRSPEDNKHNIVTQEVTDKYLPQFPFNISLHLVLNLKFHFIN